MLLLFAIARMLDATEYHTYEGVRGWANVNIPWTCTPARVAHMLDAGTLHNPLKRLRNWWGSTFERVC